MPGNASYIAASNTVRGDWTFATAAKAGSAIDDYLLEMGIVPGDLAAMTNAQKVNQWGRFISQHWAGAVRTRRKRIAAEAAQAAADADMGIE